MKEARKKNNCETSTCRYIVSAKYVEHMATIGQSGFSKANSRTTAPNKDPGINLWLDKKHTVF